jgi:predicted ATPase
VADFEMLPPLMVKGKAAPVAAGRLSGMKHAGEMRIDELPPARQLVLKVASLLGNSFEENLLHAIYPVEREKPNIPAHLQALVEAGMIPRQPAAGGCAPVYQFPDSDIQQTAYNLMLFSQRRQLHRLAAECIERTAACGPQERFARLARHWKGAEDYPRAVACLEKAGEQAREKGQLTEAQAFLQESLALEQAVFGGAVGRLAPS